MCVRTLDDESRNVLECGLSVGAKFETCKFKTSNSLGSVNRAESRTVILGQSELDERAHPASGGS